MATERIERLGLSEEALVRLRKRLRDLKRRWGRGTLGIDEGVEAVLDAYVQACVRYGHELSRPERTALRTMVYNRVVKAGWILRVQSAELPGGQIPIDSAEPVPTRPGRAIKGAAAISLVELSERIRRASDRYWREADRRQEAATTIGSVRVDTAEEREKLLQDFRAFHDPPPSNAAIMRSANAYKPEFAKWRRGKLKSSSVTAKHIVDVLLGRVPFRDRKKIVGQETPYTMNRPDRDEFGRRPHDAD